MPSSLGCSRTIVYAPLLAPRRLASGPLSALGMYELRSRTPKRQTGALRSVGIFGGTFNPIHVGHLAVAEDVAESQGLDRIIFIPSGRPPHKPGEAIPAARHRLEMIRLAIAGNRRFSVSDVELRLRGPSYSVRTIPILQKKLGASARLFFLVGLDAFLEIPTWHEPERLLTLCDFIVIFRAVPGGFSGVTTFPYPVTADRRALAEFDRGTRSSVIGTLPGGREVRFIRSHDLPVSATEIRRRLAAGRTVKYLLPAPVGSYIINHGLYGASRSRP